MNQKITFFSQIYLRINKTIKKIIAIVLFSCASFLGFSQVKYYSNFPTAASSHETSTADQITLPVVGTISLGTFTNPQNVADLDTTNVSSYASAAVVITALLSNVNLLSGLSINVQADINLASFTSTSLNGGSVAGFLIDNTGGLVNVSLANTITLSTYLNNNLVESTTSPTVTMVSSISSTAQDFHFTTSSGKNFNQVRISFGSALLGANLLSTTKFYYAYGITPASVLPVSFTSFTALSEGKSVKLGWATATEINNTGFAVERSKDGSTFSQIDFVASKATGGNSSAALSYTDVDANPLAGINYYRLKQVDFDGHFSYSDIQAVSTTAISVAAKVYPNPVTNLVNIETGSPGTYVAELFTVDGKKVKSTQLSTVSGLVTFNIDRTNITSGMYLLKMTSTSASTSTYNTIMIK